MSINYKKTANVLAIIAALCGASAGFLATIDNSAQVANVLLGLAAVLAPLAAKLFHTDSQQQPQPVAVEAQPVSDGPQSAS